MAITWTIIVLGALLHDASTQNTTLGTTKPPSVVQTSATSAEPTKSTSTITTSVNNGPPTTATIILSSTTPTMTSTNLKSTTPTMTPTALKSTIPAIMSTSYNPTTSTKQNTIITTKDPIPSSASLLPTQQSSMSYSPKVTTQITTIQPTTHKSNTSPTNSNLSIEISTSTIQDTTSSNKPATTTHKTNGTYPDNQTDRSAGATNRAPPESASTVLTSTLKQETQTTSAPIISTTPPGTTKPFEEYVLDLSHSSKGKGDVLYDTCKMLAQNGNCLVTITIGNKTINARVKINADQQIPSGSDESLEQRVDEPIPDTLIAILASSGALVLILCCFAAYCTYHRRSYRKNQQHLTEEMQTVENGYHDNPTLEVMEVQPEMQEKKLTLNGEFNDSWIVPIDNLLKEDIPDEEDTHL